MTWQAPWVWAGLLTVAFPVLIHLLGRGMARRLPFPTLRFFGETRPLPTRRTRVHDLLLLAVRVAVLVAAVAALARPLLLTAHRRSEFNASLARVVIVDTSASMQRTIATGERAIDAALRASARFADSAATSIVLRTAAPGRAIRGAATWLGRQSGRAELVIISDFQVGALDRIDLAALPDGVGLRLVPMHADAAPAPMEFHARYGSSDVTARVALSATRTDVEWTSAPASPNRRPDGVSLLATSSQSATIDTLRQLVATVGLPEPDDPAHQVAIVFPGYPGRDALLHGNTPIHQAWMADVLARVHADRPHDTGPSAIVPPADTMNTVLVTHGAMGLQSIRAAANSTDGDERLLILPLWKPLDATPLLISVERALSNAPEPSERDPATLADSTLAAWSRAPGIRTAAGPDSDTSDGRWFWIAAVVLLGVEALLRRARPEPTPSEIAHDAAR